MHIYYYWALLNLRGPTPIISKDFYCSLCTCIQSRLYYHRSHGNIPMWSWDSLDILALQTPHIVELFICKRKAQLKEELIFKIDIHSSFSMCPNRSTSPYFFILEVNIQDELFFNIFTNKLYQMTVEGSLMLYFVEPIIVY